MTTGIYKITNITNNKVYIGSSINISSREYKHFWMLDRGTHDNPHLQNSFNKYGPNNFNFEILELCDESSLIEKENHYISSHRSNIFEFGYNLATVNESRRNNYNTEVKIKLSKYNLIKNGNFTMFSLTNIMTGKEYIFESLVDAANYLIENGFSKGKPTNVRMKISQCLRGLKVNNGHKNQSLRKTCYKHNFKIIK